MKIWKIRNNSLLAWKPGVKLVCTGPNDLCNWKEQVQEFGIPLPRRHERYVVTKLEAPRKPGFYTAYFRFRSPDKIDFGSILSVRIKVVVPSVFQINAVPVSSDVDARTWKDDDTASEGSVHDEFEDFLDEATGTLNSWSLTSAERAGNVIGTSSSSSSAAPRISTGQGAGVDASSLA